MKNLTLFVFTLLFINISYSKDYTLHGFMGVQGGETFEYILKISDSSNGYFKGFAFTKNSNQQQYVKANVILKWNKDQKLLTISEKSIVQNYNFQSRATICLIQANLLYNDTLSSFSGSLQSVTSSNETCARGSLQFINKEENLNFLKGDSSENVINNPVVVTKAEQPKIPVKSQVKKSIEPAKQIPEKKIYSPVADKPKEITKGKSQEIIWNTNEIKMSIWDGGIPDNDMVTILVNGKEVLTEYTLVKSKKEIVIPITQASNIITIKAENEGNEPPNTANILLTDGQVTHEIVANNDSGNSANIIIKKAQ